MTYSCSIPTTKLQLRDKLLITSGHLITGDRNIGNEYFGRAKTNFISHDILIRGEVAEESKIIKATRKLKLYMQRIKNTSLWTENIEQWKTRIRKSVDFEIIKSRSKSWDTIEAPKGSCNLFMKYLLAPLLRDQL